jgi:LysM repeat protein
MPISLRLSGDGTRLETRGIQRGTHVVYTVRPGDTLYSIANQFGTSVPAIIEANALYPPVADPGLIYPGQKLLVRVPGMTDQSAVIHQVTEGDTMFRLAERYSHGLEMLAAVNQMQHPEILPVARLVNVLSFVYEVEPGDSLFRIAGRLGVPMSTIARANQGRPGFSPDVLYPGFRLVVPLPSSTNIAVFQPLPSTPITAGQPLTGIARAFEAAVLYRIVDAAGQTVTGEQPFMTDAGAPMFGSFEVPIKIERKPAAASGTLMVYTRSARDGSIQDLVEVAVTFG